MRAATPTRTRGGLPRLVAWLAGGNRYDDPRWPQLLAAVTPEDVAASCRAVVRGAS
jgi:hypothetical protein